MGVSEEHRNTAMSGLERVHEKLQEQFSGAFVLPTTKTIPVLNLPWHVESANSTDHEALG